MAGSPAKFMCPMCGEHFARGEIETHAALCADAADGAFAVHGSVRA